MAELPTSGAGAWSSALSGKSDDEKEELLDRMLTRLALCDDSKLQDLLAKILPLSIAALSSASAPLRNKVIEILSHVNKRVKHQPIIGLPLSDLWKLYLESSSAPMVRNFCIVYIEMAIDRVEKEEKLLRAPVFLTNISKLPSQHQDILLRITGKVIGECHTSQVSDEVLEKYRTLVGSKDLEIFLEFCLHTILYQPSFQSGGLPAGFSTIQLQRVTGNDPPDHDKLRNRKCRGVFWSDPFCPFKLKKKICVSLDTLLSTFQNPDAAFGGKKTDATAITRRSPVTLATSRSAADDWCTFDKDGIKWEDACCQTRWISTYGNYDHSRQER